MISGINPFKVKNKTKFEKLQMISSAKIPYFPIFSDVAKSLLKALLVANVSLFYFTYFFISLVKDWVLVPTESKTLKIIHFSRT